MKPSKLIATIICLSLIIISAGCTDSGDTTSETAPAEETPVAEQPTEPSTKVPPTEQTNVQHPDTPSDQNLTIHFLDVGQGDSILIEYNNKDC